MPRCFFALPLSGDALDALDAHRRALEPEVHRSGVRASWVARDCMHVTLAFLGDIAPDDVSVLRDAMAPVTGATAPIATTLGAVDAFPGPRRARVLVAALDDAEGAIARLATTCQRAATRIGNEPERRRFRPHATLARLRAPLDVRRMLDGLPARPVPVALDRVVLFESRISPQGTAYVPLVTLPLGG
jgi:2'-5' RNA ligase